jgi:hypothetical protein
MKLPALLREVYFEAGAGLHAAQHLEWTITYMLFVLGKSDTFSADFSKGIGLSEDRSKATLGRLILLLRGVVTFPEESEAVLAKALNARNDLIHHYLADNVGTMISPEGRAKMSTEIRLLRHQILAGSRVLDPLIQMLCESRGIPMATLKNNIKDLIE